VGKEVKSMKIKETIRCLIICLLVIVLSTPSLFTVEAAETHNGEANGVAVDSLGNVIITGYIDDGEQIKFYTVKHAEDSGNILWEREFDEYNYNDAKGVAVDSQDNIIVVGAVNDTGLLQGYDYCLVKYDTDGTKLWDKKYGRKMYDTPLGIAVDSMDNIIVTGMSGRIEFTPQLTIDLDFWTIKCDSNGNKLNEDAYNLSDLDTPYDVAVDSQDNIIITGIINYSERLAYYTIKYSSTLSKIWEKHFSNGFEDAGLAIAVDSEDNIIVTGGSSDDSSLNYGTIKYTSDGSQFPSWPKFYDSGGKDDARAVAVDFDDNIIVTGGSNGKWYTIKYDKNGNMKWGKDPDIKGEARGVTVDGGNNIIVTGYREDNSIRKFYTIKYTANGDIIWDSSYSGSPPVASFTWSQKTKSRTMTFADSSVDDRGLQSWQWDFGDGSISYQRNPEHNYIQTGTYNVTLIVTDTDGNTDMKSQYVTVVNIKPVVNFAYSPLNPLTNETITFTDQSEDYDGDIVSWLWDFRDGETSTLQNPTHSYTVPGTYIVRLFITDNDQETVARTKSIIINPPASSNVYFQGIEPLYTNEHIEISITITPKEAIAGAQFDMSFDPSMLSVDWMAGGDLFSEYDTYFNPGVIDNTNGTLKNVISLITTPGGSTTNQGNIAIVAIRAKTIPGETPLNLSNVIVGRPDATPIDVTIINTTVMIYRHDRWDVNWDDRVNILDLILIGQWWGEMGTPCWVSADVNCDGVINILDMILVGQHWTG